MKYCCDSLGPLGVLFNRWSQLIGLGEKKFWSQLWLPLQFEKHLNLFKEILHNFLFEDSFQGYCSQQNFPKFHDMYCQIWSWYSLPACQLWPQWKSLTTYLRTSAFFLVIYDSTVLKYHQFLSFNDMTR